MKYFEAIDMILDGGRATNSNEKKWWIWFTQSCTKTSRSTRWGEAGDLIIGIDEQICNVFTFNKKHVHEDNWIVEKDGVVYEEYHPFVGKKEWFKTFSEDVSCPQCGSKILIKIVPYNTYACLSCSYNGLIYIKDRTHEQDEPAELEESDKQLEEIKMPIIADQVNEDWLEKKMLCFMKRVYIAGGIERCDKKVDGSITEVITPDLEYVLIFNCENEDCHFCCSEESECEVCFPDVSKEDKAQGAIDQPRKKVTVKHMDDLLQKIRGIAYKRGALRQAWLDADEMDYVNDFQQKLEYLVSLQEKA